MANVPNTTTFCLTDVTTIVGGTCLSSAFTNACSSWFDPSYGGTCSCLLNFRNYTEVTGYDVTVDTWYTGGGECACGTWVLRCCTGGYVSSQYIETSYGNMCFTVNNIPSGCYYVDFSNILSYLTGVPITTFYMWSIDIDGYGYSCCTANFNLNTNACVCGNISDSI
jgi:hypothetical protein